MTQHHIQTQHGKESRRRCRTHTQSTTMNRTRKHISAHFSQRGKKTMSPNDWRNRRRKNQKLRSLDFCWTTKPQDDTYNIVWEISQRSRICGTSSYDCFTDKLRRFYVAYQEVQETVPQFIIRFQNLHKSSQGHPRGGCKGNIPRRRKRTTPNYLVSSRLQN